jgi:hypothetical protein
MMVRSRVVGIAKFLTAQALPFCSEYIALRRLPLPPNDAVVEVAKKNVELLKADASVVDQVSSIESADSARAASMDGKAVGVLTVISVIAAVLGAVQILGWSSLTLWEKAVLTLSDFYGATSFFEILHAVRTGKEFIFTQDDVEGCLKEPLASGTSLETQTAALRLAFVWANTNTRLRLSNRIDSAFISARNAVLLAILGLTPAGLAHFN